VSHIFILYSLYILKPFDFRNFTKDDIRVRIDRENGTVSFVVIDPDTGLPLPAREIKDAISGSFMSVLHGLSLTITPDISNDNEAHDWPLILGLCFGGVLLFGLVILSIIL
jgi:hypothetical protein